MLKGEEDIRRQKLNVFNMRMLGAEVRPIRLSPLSLWTDCNRTIHQAEALAWLDANPAAAGASVITSLPDVTEVGHRRKAGEVDKPLAGKTLAMVFDKRSTRTRMSFEVAMKQLGGHTLVMNAEESAVGVSEVVDETMASAAKIHATENGRDVRRYALLAFGGAGLGLSISKRLCEFLGGTISVESEPGRWTRFRVSLPVAVPGESS